MSSLVSPSRFPINLFPQRVGRASKAILKAARRTFGDQVITAQDGLGGTACQQSCKGKRTNDAGSTVGTHFESPKKGAGNVFSVGYGDGPELINGGTLND